MSLRLPAVFLLCVALTGCGGCGNGDAGPGVVDGGGKPEEELPEWHGEMTIKPMDAAELEQFIASHQGKVVVVHLWATWSDATMRGLQDLMTLQKRLGEQVVAIAVNTDAALESPDGAEAKVKPPLDRADARIPNVLSTTPDEELFGHFGLETFGVVVYDQSGEVAQRFNYALEFGQPDPFSYEKDVVPLVKTLTEQ